MIALSKKICLLGDSAVGKTSLVRRFAHNRFDNQYVSPIGVRVSNKVVVIPAGNEFVELTILLWDLAGSQEFDSMRLSYLRGATGAVAVCDLTRPETLDSLPIYANELRLSNPEAHLIVAANKADLRDNWQLTEERVRTLAVALGVPCFFTSAKTDECVDEVFRQLGRMLVEVVSFGAPRDSLP